MHSLKSALSTKEAPSKIKGDSDNSLLKGVNKSKNQSLWALDLDQDEAATEESLQTDQLMRDLNEILSSTFQREGKTLSEISFERIVEEFQDKAGGSKSELSYLMVIEDKLSDLLDFAKDDFRFFLDLFSDMLARKIARLRTREKKSELSNFDKIANGGNFRKKAEDSPYLAVEGKPKKFKEDRLASKSPQNDNSSENKLKRLFSKDKKNVKGVEKSTSNREEAEVHTTTVAGQEEVSFSALLSTSVGVKSRKRKSSNEFKKVAKPKKQERQQEKGDGEEAFLFFRPKKGKK